MSAGIKGQPLSRYRPAAVFHLQTTAGVLIQVILKLNSPVCVGILRAPHTYVARHLILSFQKLYFCPIELLDGRKVCNVVRVWEERVC